MELCKANSTELSCCNQAWVLKNSVIAQRLFRPGVVVLSSLFGF